MEEQNNQQNSQEPVRPVGKQDRNADEDQKNNDVEENKVITYLSYLGILFLIPMLVKKESKFAMFHAKQGLILTVGWFLGGFLYVFLGLGFLIHLAIIILSIMGLVNVHNGKMKKLPIVGELSEKINI